MHLGPLTHMNAIMEHPNCLGSALLFRSYILGQDYGLLIMPHVHPYFDLLTFLREAGQWAFIIQEIDLVINHHSGKSNSNADALSRNPMSAVSAVETVDTIAADIDFTSRIRTITADQKLPWERGIVIWLSCDYLESGTLPEDEI